jgi:hypothetical protein
MKSPASWKAPLRCGINWGYFHIEVEDEGECSGICLLSGVKTQ